MIEVLQKNAQKSRYYSSELLKFQHEIHILGSQGFRAFAHKSFSPLQKNSICNPLLMYQWYLSAFLSVLNDFITCMCAQAEESSSTLSAIGVVDGHSPQTCNLSCLLFKANKLTVWWHIQLAQSDANMIWCDFVPEDNDNRRSKQPLHPLLTCTCARSKQARK